MGLNREFCIKIYKMEETLISLVNGVPIAAAVLYVWIVSEKNNRKEIESWRETVNKKDEYLVEMQKAISKLSEEINKLTFIIENYVVGKRKDFTGK